MEIRDGNGKVRDDLDDKALLDAILHRRQSVVGGATNELRLLRTEPEWVELTLLQSLEGQYMVTHIDTRREHRTAIADGDPSAVGVIQLGSTQQSWPGDHFVTPVIAHACAETFVYLGARDACVEWRPNMRMMDEIAQLTAFFGGSSARPFLTMTIREFGGRWRNDLDLAGLLDVIGRGRDSFALLREAPAWAKLLCEAGDTHYTMTHIDANKQTHVAVVDPATAVRVVDCFSLQGRREPSVTWSAKT